MKWRARVFDADENTHTTHRKACRVFELHALLCNIVCIASSSCAKCIASGAGAQQSHHLPQVNTESDMLLKANLYMRTQWMSACVCLCVLYLPFIVHLARCWQALCAESNADRIYTSPRTRGLGLGTSVDVYLRCSGVFRGKVGFALTRICVWLVRAGNTLGFMYVLYIIGKVPKCTYTNADADLVLYSVTYTAGDHSEQSEHFTLSMTNRALNIVKPRRRHGGSYAHATWRRLQPFISLHILYICICKSMGAV